MGKMFFQQTLQGDIVNQFGDDLPLTWSRIPTSELTRHEHQRHMYVCGLLREEGLHKSAWFVAFLVALLLLAAGWKWTCAWAIFAATALAAYNTDPRPISAEIAEQRETLTLIRAELRNRVQPDHQYRRGKP